MARGFVCLERHLVFLAINQNRGLNCVGLVRGGVSMKTKSLLARNSLVEGLRLG